MERRSNSIMLDPLMRDSEGEKTVRVSVVSRWRLLRWKLLLMCLCFPATVAVYTFGMLDLVVPVPYPAYTNTVSISLTGNSDVQDLYDAGTVPYITVYDLIITNSWELDNYCGPVDMQHWSEYGYIINFLNMTAGCNITFIYNYTVPYQINQFFEMLLLIGFDYPGRGDLSVISSGFVNRDGTIDNFQTSQVTEVITGSAGGNVILNLQGNNFVGIVIPWQQAITFSLACFGVIWGLIDLVFKVYLKIRRHQNFSSVLYGDGEIQLVV